MSRVLLYSRSAQLVGKTHLTTDQFIKVWQSLDEPKKKEVSVADSAAWDTAWYAARYTAWHTAWSTARAADLAILVKDKISDEQFEILTKPWTSCGLSLYAEDWDEVLNPKMEATNG